LAFFAAAILVLSPALAIAQQDAQGNQAAGTQNQTAPNAAQGAGAQGADASATDAKPGKGMKKMMKGMHAAGTCPCPYCPAKEDKAADAKDVHGRQMRMMMNARLSKDDPGMLLGMRKDLNLTPEQAQQLEQIQAETKQKVQAILTDEQRTQLAQVPDKATSMRDMHQQMASKMKGDKAGNADPGAIDKPDEETAARDAPKDLMNK
jgi:hypothetical protein